MTTTTQAGRFAAAIFAPTDIVEIRLLPSRKSEWVTADRLGEWVAPKDQNVYVGANPRRMIGGRDADAVVMARCLFVDFDGVGLEEAAAKVSSAGLPEPTVVVASGGGVHCWWRLAEPMTDLVAWTLRQKALIAVLGSDKVIHDVPRIMRLPGTMNVKRGRPCEIVECDPEQVYGLDLFPTEGGEERPATPQTGMILGGIPATALAASGTKANPGGFAGLSRATLLFLHTGAVEGERNAKLFAAACDYAGCHIPQAQAENDLVAAAARCGLSDDEALSAVRSAYGKSRVPARPTVVATEVARSVPAEGGEEPDPGYDQPAKGRHSLSNVTDQWREKVVAGRDGKAKSATEHYTEYKPIERIAGEILHASGGWPKLLGTVPFVIRGYGIDASAIHLPDASDLFAWLHGEMDVRWTEKPCEDPVSGAARTPQTKTELHRYIKQGRGGVEFYRMVTAYPHQPPMKGVYYMPIDLPPATGAALAEFLAHLNPATELDRGLMLSCLLTMFWGGEPGTRPLFVFTSDAGMGAGKTATAAAFADIAGGAASLNYEDKWADVSKSLFSSNMWNARNLLFDNVKGRFGGSAIEAVATAKTLTGWKSYVGQIERPNDATILVTFNQPEMTADMARRSVIIKIGTPKHDKSFVAWAEDFISENRMALIADLLAILKRKPHQTIPAAKLDRWQRWSAEVLCRIDGAEDLADLITKRRPEVDSDADDAINLAEALLEATVGDSITTREIYLAAKSIGQFSDAKDKSYQANAKDCITKVRRILSGREILEPKLSENGKPARRRVTGENGEKLGWSVIYALNRKNLQHTIDSGVGEADTDLPV